jgi:hypothetical protein
MSASGFRATLGRWSGVLRDFRLTSFRLRGALAHGLFKFAEWLVTLLLDASRRHVLENTGLFGYKSSASVNKACGNSARMTVLQSTQEK